MARHSKNNTASPVFTYAERSKLKYGSLQQRMSRDSLRRYDVCYLCLQPARQPMSCLKGHIGCKECVYEHMISQKRSIALEEEERKRGAKKKDDEEKQRDAEDKALFLEKFEQTQNRTRIQPHLHTRPSSSHKDSQSPPLPSYWLPSLAPVAKLEHDESLNKVIKKTPECTAAQESHPISLKKLFPIHFTLLDSSMTPHSDTTGNKDVVDTQVIDALTEKVCPACRKSLNHSTRVCAFRGCGHVLCKGCTQKFVLQDGQCYVCQGKVRSKEVIELTQEGTGYAGGGGQIMAKKHGLAFQG